MRHLGSPVAATLAAVGLFLALWVVVPPPLPLLLNAAAIAPEIAPLLVGWGAVVAALGLVRAFGWATRRALLGAGVAAAALALVPLVQLPAAVRRFDGAMR
ncbi:MAG: hypothetical protein AVDCRST_MAG11-3272, partial [uncultured Gemmatimonadaceae bacterium]